ncbi:MAG: hypothetical protein KAR20_03690 [Candidatus Heimdallarchaeota archaeon]|nr:hypothetical protein [Candidatus Heimdallarchaeota archaeon]
MLKAVTNPTELSRLIESAARRVMESAAKEILSVFKNQYVRKYAYVQGPTQYHNPNGQEFLEAWEWDEIKKVSGMLSMTMFNNWMKMTPGSRAAGDFVHSSYSKSYPDDTREYLAQWLDELKSPISGHRTGKYWVKFISEMLESGKLKRIIDKHARANGFEPSAMGIL